MFKPENAFDFFSNFDGGDFKFFINLLKDEGKTRFLKDERCLFNLHGVEYDGFQQDVFLVFVNTFPRLVIAGDRKYVDGRESNDFFGVRDCAVCSSSNGLVFSIFSSKKYEFNVIRFNSDNPNRSALEFLLNHLPDAATRKNIEFLAIARGESSLVYFESAQIDKFISLHTSEELKLRKSKIHSDEWRLAVVNSEPFGTPGIYSKVHKNVKTFRYNDAHEAVATTKPRLYKRLIQNTRTKNEPSYRYSDSKIENSITLEQAILAKLDYLKSSKIYADGDDSTRTFGHFEALIPGDSLVDWLEPKYFIRDDEADNQLRPILKEDLALLRMIERYKYPTESRLVEKNPMIETLSAEQRIRLSIALIDALLLVSNEGVIHCDIKPANIVVAMENDKFVAKLIDFNLSRLSSDNTPNVKTFGSPLYFSPESLQDKVPKFASDVFSLGIVLAQCWGATFDHFGSLEDVFKAVEKPYCFHNLFAKVMDLTEQHRESIEHILKSMVSLNPEKRPCSTELKNAFEGLSVRPVPASLVGNEALVEPPKGSQIPQCFFSPQLRRSNDSSVVEGEDIKCRGIF